LDFKPNYSAYYLETDYKTKTEFTANIINILDKKQGQNSQLKIKKIKVIFLCIHLFIQIHEKYHRVPVILNTVF